MKDFRNPSNVHPPLGGYSHQVEISGSERILIVSGQVGMREDGTLPEDPLEQVDIAMENILRNLRAAHMDVKDIVKLTYYLVGDVDTVKRRELVASKLQGHKPCSTLLYVTRLATPALKVEIDAWASNSKAMSGV
jgi:enamine deaminase RidA (YjgF/YER057c/UK114 family)